MQTARDWGAKPTEFFNDWSSRDQGLAVALAMVERSRCPQCGTWHDEKDLTVEQEHCRGCELLHNAQENGAHDKPGTKYRLLPISEMERD